jgi:hypothetical protein
MSREKRRLRIKVDGKPIEFEVGKEWEKSSNTALLRLIEYRYLFPERSIKYVEFKGEKLHPSKVDFVKEIEQLNVVTEPSANMVRKQLELSVLALEGMANAIDQIVADWKERPELAKLMLHNLLDSLDWSVKVVENGSRIIPIVDGIDEEIASLEDAVFKVDDLMYEGREEEALRAIEGELKRAVERWKEFLGKVVKLIKSAPKETH